METQPTRDDFVTWISKRLSDLGFKQNENKESWDLDRAIQSPPQVLIVNGQRHEREGATRRLKFRVEVFGDGEMKDINTQVVNSFIEVDFDIFEDDSSVSDIPTTCMFYDDNGLFDDILNNLLKM